MMLFIYRRVLMLTRWLAHKVLSESTQVWARNSFRLGYFQNWKSDLDLTFYYAQDSNLKLIRSHRIFFAWIHRFFPMICECNVYFKNDLASIQQTINFYEWQRDPELSSLIKLDRRPSEMEAAAFISRMMISDFKNLQKQLSFRKKKWGFHFQQVGEVFKDQVNFLGQIFHLLAKKLKLSETDEKEMAEELLAYGNFLQQGQTSLDLRGQLHNKKWLWTFFPHHFPFAAHELPPLSQTQLNLMFEQLRWEIFAALTQYANFSEPIFKAQLSDCRLLIAKVIEQNPADLRWPSLSESFTNALEKIS